LQFDDQNKPKVCAYMNLATSEAQQKWHSYQLELYAIGMAFRQNETFLLQSEIEIFTDNAVCVAIEKYKPLNARETRLIAYLSQFNFTIRYIPGRMNRVADALSRLPEDVKTSDLHEFKPPDHIKNEEFILAVTEQQQDMKTVEQTEESSGKTEDWTVYRITYEDEGQAEKTHTLNPEATIFVPARQDPQNELGALVAAAPVTSETSDGQQGLQDMQQNPAPIRRSAHIAIRRARAAE